MNYFLIELGYHISYESLDRAWETKTHSRARGGCHVSTFPGRDVTFYAYHDLFVMTGYLAMGFLVVVWILIYKLRFLTRGLGPIYKRNSVEFSVDFLVLGKL